MTVTDLINRLKELPPDVPVYIEADQDYYNIEIVGVTGRMCSWCCGRRWWRKLKGRFWVSLDPGKRVYRDIQTGERRYG